jgi:3-hydroxybutyryl-CoA dehydrogenase
MRTEQPFVPTAAMPAPIRRPGASSGSHGDYCTDGMARESVAILGSGVMAEGIARACVGREFDVVVVAGSPERADALCSRLLAGAPHAVVSAGPEGLAGCSILVEATVESMEAKRPALELAENRLAATALMASTTSSLSVTELAGGLRFPERFLGLHFFNPVDRMRLVEVVGGVRTSAEAEERGAEWARALGKVPVRVKDRAGFLVNRLLIPYLNEAARLAEANLATPEEIDMAMRLGAAHPMGPFELIDLIGADVCLAVGRSLFDEYHGIAHAPSPEIRRRVALGLLGRKSGRGYYDSPSGR